MTESTASIHCCIYMRTWLWLQNASSEDETKDKKEGKSADGQSSNDLFSVHDFNIEIDLDVPGSGNTHSVVLSSYSELSKYNHQLTKLLTKINTSPWNENGYLFAYYTIACCILMYG